MDTKGITMKKQLKRLFAGFMTVLILSGAFFDKLPVLAGTAAETSALTYRLKSGTNNGNTHFGGERPEAFVLTEAKTYKKADFSYTIKLNSELADTRMRFVTKYADDNKWAYFAYDTDANGSYRWFYEYKGDTSDHPIIVGLPKINKNDVVNITGTWGEDELTLRVENTTTNEIGISTIDDPAFSTICEAPGQLGFGAAWFGTASTEFEFSKVKYDDTDYAAGWDWYREIEGQSLTNPEEIKEEEEPIVLDDGSNNKGGHDYGQPADPAFLYDSTKSMPMDGEMSLTFDITKYDYISSSSMKAYIGKDFPVVARYVVGPDVFCGQSEMLDKVEINGVSITPDVTPQTDFISGTASKTYSVALKDEKSGIDMVMDVKISIDKNNLTWEAVKITKNAGCPPIVTINVPRLNLISVESDQTGAGFAGAKASTTTTQPADVFSDFNDFTPVSSDSYLYAFLTYDKLSAGLWSNSEAENDKRIRLHNSAETMSLTSAPWYYERGAAAAAKTAYEFPAKSELPCAKVAIAGDLNGDGKLDWNDGALAYRSIMNYPQGSEVVKEMVNHRIVMNYAGMAPNPYLKTADNVKKVYMATDGLSQSILLKGYGNEGQDSSNSEYADIAEHQGGLEDFQKLLQMSHKYNTEVGINISAQETYPESASFSEKIVADLAALKADAAKQKDNLDFIYLDVWYQDSWETRRVAEEINSLGWRFTTEYSAQGEYDSAWQHWSTDAVSGGAGAKGLNSDIIRFLRNDHKDSHVLNYPSFGGTADNPLLGGYRLYGFEGWGQDQNFNNYIKGTYNENLPTRFLQHYYVTKWENYADDETGKTTSPVGNHEKEITLKNDAGDTVVVTRNEKQRNDSNIERTITLNGKVVLNDVTYLLPWTDVENKEEKLYHWNLDGGTTTWDLQDGWKSLGTVIIYELSDQGRINKKTINVSGGKVTLEAKAATPYILVKDSTNMDDIRIVDKINT